MIADESNSRDNILTNIKKKSFLMILQNACLYGNILIVSKSAMNTLPELANNE